MKLSDFWERMDETFGAGYARSVASDHSIGMLGGRTVDPAEFMRKYGVARGTGPTAPKTPVGPLPAPDKTPVTPILTPWEELLDMFKNKADFQRFLDRRLEQMRA